MVLMVSLISVLYCLMLTVDFSMRNMQTTNCFDFISPLISLFSFTLCELHMEIFHVLLFYVYTTFVCLFVCDDISIFGKPCVAVMLLLLRCWHLGPSVPPLLHLGAEYE